MNKERVINSLGLLIRTLEQGDSSNQYGICNIIYKLVDNDIICCISAMELSRVIKANRPSKQNQYKQFTDNKYWIDRGFWWTEILIAPETKKIRIAFLNKLIDNIKNGINE